MNKKIGFLAAGLMTLSLMSCSGVNAKDVAQEAARGATILSENYEKVTSQIQMINQITVLVGEEDFVVPITWESSQFTILEDKDLHVTYATPINLPEVGAADVEYTLTATATYKGAKAQKVFTGKLSAATKVDKVTVAELKEMPVDANKEVIVEGIIRKSFGGSKSAVLTDDTGSILVYTTTAIDSYIPGRKVAIRGTRGSHGKWVLDSSDKSGNTYIKQTDDPSKNLEISYPELIYTSMEVLEICDKQASLQSAISTTVDEVNKWVVDPTNDSFVNHSGELLKMTCDIVKYDPGAYHVWEACPVGQTKPYIQFYCDSSVGDNLNDIDNYLKDFENKKVELGLFVYDFNSKRSTKKNSDNTETVTFKNVFRVIPVSVTVVA